MDKHTTAQQENQEDHEGADGEGQLGVVLVPTATTATTHRATTRSQSTLRMPAFVLGHKEGPNKRTKTKSAVNINNGHITSETAVDGQSANGTERGDIAQVYCGNVEDAEKKNGGRRVRTETTTARVVSNKSKEAKKMENGTSSSSNSALFDGRIYSDIPHGFLTKRQFRADDVVLARGGYDRGLYRVVIGEWWERYEVASNPAKRDVAARIIDDMHRRGVRFLSLAGICCSDSDPNKQQHAQLFAVEPVRSDQILKKILRAMRHEVNQRLAGAASHTLPSSVMAKRTQALECVRNLWHKRARKLSSSSSPVHYSGDEDYHWMVRTFKARYPEQDVSKGNAIIGTRFHGGSGKEHNSAHGGDDASAAVQEETADDEEGGDEKGGGNGTHHRDFLGCKDKIRSGKSKGRRKAAESPSAAEAAEGEDDSAMPPPLQAPLRTHTFSSIHDIMGCEGELLPPLIPSAIAWGTSDFGGFGDATHTSSNKTKAASHDTVTSPPLLLRARTRDRLLPRYMGPPDTAAAAVGDTTVAASIGQTKLSSAASTDFSRVFDDDFAAAPMLQNHGHDNGYHDSKKPLMPPPFAFRQSSVGNEWIMNMIGDPNALKPSQFNRPFNHDQLGENAGTAGAYDRYEPLYGTPYPATAVAGISGYPGCSSFVTVNGGSCDWSTQQTVRGVTPVQNHDEPDGSKPSASVPYFHPFLSPRRVSYHSSVSFSHGNGFTIVPSIDQNNPEQLPTPTVGSKRSISQCDAAFEDQLYAAAYAQRSLELQQKLVVLDAKLQAGECEAKRLELECDELWEHLSTMPEVDDTTVFASCSKTVERSESN
jgi:hypothetical protein